MVDQRNEVLQRHVCNLQMRPEIQMVNQLKDEENKDRFTINWSRDWKKVIWRASHCDAIVG